MSRGQRLRLPFTLYLSPVKPESDHSIPCCDPTGSETPSSLQPAAIFQLGVLLTSYQLKFILQREARVWFQYTWNQGLQPLVHRLVPVCHQLGRGDPAGGGRANDIPSTLTAVPRHSGYCPSSTCQARSATGLSEEHKPYYEVCMQEIWVVHSLWESSWNHPTSTSCFMEKWPPMKLVPGAKKVGDRCIRPHHSLVLKPPLAYTVRVLSCFYHVWLFVTQWT